VIAVRLVKTSILSVSAVVLLAALVASPALAQSGWWHLNSASRPGNLHSGTVKDEVLGVTVKATGGAFYLVEVIKGEYQFTKFTRVAYNASAAQVQEQLEGEVFQNRRFSVSGGPTATGSKYMITLPDQSSVGLAALGAELSGEEAEATVKGVSSGGPPDGTLVVTAANLGDATVNGGETAVRIADKLPAGLQAVDLEGIAEDRSGITFGRGPVACSLKSMTCTYAGTLPPYEQIEVLISVIVEPGASSGEVNEASVSGGGALASVKHPVMVSDEPTPFGVENYELEPEEEGGAIDTQAGSHPFQLTTTLALNQTADGHPVALTKDLNFKLPPGLIGNPVPFPQCTLAQFLTAKNGELEDECSAQTALGIASVHVDEPVFIGLIEIPEPLFNLEPATGEPARFGFYVPGGVPVLLDTSVRTGGDYGVTVSVDNITQIAAFIRSRVTFWGVPGDPRHNNVRGWGCLNETIIELSTVHAPCNIVEVHHPPPLLDLPTSCTGPLQTSVEANSWTNEGSFQSMASEPMQALDGCNRLPFSPSIIVTPDGKAGASPTGLTVDVHVPQSVSLNGEGLSEADVKDTTVTLPAGVAINPAGADGLLACSEAQIALASDTFPTCPESSKIGTVEVKSPLLPNPLVGAAYLAAQNENPFGSLVAMYFSFQDPVSGTLIKVAGEVKPDPVTGQLVATFKNTPQLPFEDLTLHFFGGSRAPLSTPSLCGDYTSSAAIAPWTANPAVGSSSTFEIDSGPNGSPCHDPLPFAPSLTAETTSIQAGGYSPFSTTFSRADGNQNLQAIQLHMPPGLSGTLSTVKLCGEPQADKGTCGSESLIGETIVSVGVGGNPFSVRGGKVYITGPYRGAPYGLSIVNPAKAGPFDLGQVVVRAKIDVNQTTAALTATTDPSGPYAIPHIIDGIPLQIQHVNVNINRDKFTFNPTNCSPLAITGSLISSEGSTAALSVPFQITNCAVLAFKPKLTAKTSGKTSRANGASLSVKLTYPAGPYDANIAKVKVDLPKQLPSRLTTLQKACPAATFEADPANCPAASIVGHATASTPVLPVPLSGPAYFVSHGGEAFPDLIIVLQGYGTTVHLVGTTFIDKAGITSSTFKTIPDVPVGTFELTLPQGKYSALAANGNLCKSKLAMPTAFIGQNGAGIHVSTPIGVTGCPKKKAHKAKGAGAGHRHKAGASDRRTDNKHKR
jgi:hypothetical protein